MAQLVKVPKGEASRIRSNFHGWARDKTNFPVGRINPFFPRFDLVVKAVDRGRVNPFDDRTGAWRPDFRPTTLNYPALYGHGDLSETGDAAAMAFASIPKWVVSEPRGADLPPIIQPLIHIEALVRIIPQRDTPIDLEAMVGLILELQERDFQIALFTYDQFQSTHSIQRLRRAGIDSARLSIDRTTHYWTFGEKRIPGGRGAALGELKRVSTDGQYMMPYEVSRSAIYDERMSVPVYQEEEGETQFEKEARGLSDIGGTVQKAAGGEDDLIQCVVGATLNAVMNNQRDPDDSILDELRESRGPSDLRQDRSTPNMEQDWGKKYFGGKL